MLEPSSTPAPVDASINNVDAQQLKILQAEVDALRIEIEEFRSGRKLADSVQQRLKFLGEVKFDLEKRLEAKDQELKDYDNLKIALRLALNVQNIYDNITRVEELAKNLPAVLPSSSQPSEGAATVGLQASTTIVDVQATEKLVVINTENMRGKILEVARKGKLDTWRRLDDIVKAIQDERWNATPQEVNNALNDLEKQDLIAKKHTDRNYYCLAQGVKFKEVS